MSRCLVTGGAGFIGSHVVDRLVKGGWDVTVLDNLSFGRWSNVAHHDSSLGRIEADIVDSEAVERVFQEGGFRAVVHLAALHFIPYCNAHPQEAIRVNIEGTENVLASAGRHGVESVLMASSAAVYADLSSPIPESASVLPMDVYGVTKLANEHQGRIHSARIPRVVAMRFFNAVGARETNPHLVPELVRRCRISSRVPVGNTSPRRDYVDVRDVAKAVWKLLEAEGLAGFRACNVGTGRSYSVVDVVGAISRHMGREIELVGDPSLVRKVERENLQADPSLLKTIVGWSPDRNLEEMIAYAAEGAASACVPGEAQENAS